MEILVSIDDTDNIETVGTGELASRLASELGERGWGRATFVTRHQLLVHPDIPYTSHNSAMCFTADIEPSALPRLIVRASEFLESECAPGSDPGLCVAALDGLQHTDELIVYGRQAKSAVLTKSDAYSVARRAGAHLSEHGGTGQGVIGALAGVALRLGGNDGRLKGRLSLGPVGSTLTVKELLARSEVGAVRTIDGVTITDGERVMLGEKVKMVLLGGTPVLLVSPLDGAGVDAEWQTCSRKLLKDY